MAQKQHNQLTGAALHEPKGVATAVANRVYVSNGAGTGAWSQTPGTQLMQCTDVKAQNTAGGTFTAAAWQTRALGATPIINQITGASLATNQITLPAGTYDIDAYAPAFSVDKHRLRIQNITDAATLLLGPTTNAVAGGFVSTIGVISGRITIAATKVIELQHRCETTRATDGFGVLSNWTDEHFANIMIRKI